MKQISIISVSIFALLFVGAQAIAEETKLSTYNSCDLQSAITTLGQSISTLVVDCSDELPNSADITVPNNIELRFIAGGRIDGVPGGGEERLTIEGPMTGGIYERFGRHVTVLFSKGNVSQLIPTWWGFDTTNSAAENADAFNACLASAMTSKIDIHIPPGEYESDPIKWTKTVSGNVHGITIKGMKAPNEIHGDAESYFDFSGLSDTEVGFHFANDSSSGQLIGLTLKDIGLRGAVVYTGTYTSVGSTSHVGILVDGNDAIRNLELINVAVERFGIGVRVEGDGQNSWPVYTRNLHLKNNAIGYFSGDGNTVGMHDLLEVSDNIIGLYIQGVNTSQTYNSMINQQNRYGVVIDSEFGGVGAHIRGLTFNSPYFEGVYEAFRIGYKHDGSISGGSGTVKNLVVNAGQYEDFKGEKLFARNSLGEDWHNNVINAAHGVLSDKGARKIIGNPSNTIILAPRTADNNFGDISYYYDKNGQTRTDTLRFSTLRLHDGNGSNKLNISMESSLFKGDDFSLNSRNEESKGGANSFFEINENGAVITIKHPMINGGFLGAQAVVARNPYSVGIDVSATTKGDNLVLTFTESKSASRVDMTTAVNAGDIEISLIYGVTPF